MPRPSRLSLAKRSISAFGRRCLRKSIEQPPVAAFQNTLGLDRVPQASRSVLGATSRLCYLRKLCRPAGLASTGVWRYLWTSTATSPKARQVYELCRRLTSQFAMPNRLRRCKTQSHNRDRCLLVVRCCPGGCRTPRAFLLPFPGTLDRLVKAAVCISKPKN